MALSAWFDNPVFKRHAWLRLTRLRSPMSMIWPTVFVGLLFAAPLSIPQSWSARIPLTQSIRAKWAFGLPLGYLALITLIGAPTAVSLAVANDRAAGLLNSIRLTPQSAATKVLGYCIGPALPSYLSGVVAVPFLVFASIMGATTSAGLLQILMVMTVSSFFTCLLAVHIALAAKLPEPGEQTPGLLAQWNIAKRHLRPQDVGGQGGLAPMGWTVLAMIGFNFGHPALGALTPIPTVWRGFIEDPYIVTRWTGVGIGGHLVPSFVLALLVQGLFMWFLFRAACRVVQDDGARGMTRSEVLALFAAFTFIEVYTIRDAVLGGLYSGIIPMGTGGSIPLQSTHLLFGYFFVMGLFAIVFLKTISADANSLRRAWRRSHATGRTDLRGFDEGYFHLASLLPMILIASLGYFILLISMHRDGITVPATLWTAAAPALFGGMVLTLGANAQAGRLNTAAGGWAFLMIAMAWFLLPFVGHCLDLAGHGGIGPDALRSQFPPTALQACVEAPFQLGDSAPTLWAPFASLAISVNLALALLFTLSAWKLWKSRAESARLPPPDPKAPPALEAFRAAPAA